MLVLSRRLNDEILIDGGIRVKILEITGNRIRLGVLAPVEVTILRKEVPLGRDQPTNSPAEAPQLSARSLELAHAET